MNVRSRSIAASFAFILTMASLATVVPVASADHAASGGASLMGTSGLTATVRFSLDPSGACCGGQWSFSLGDGGYGAIGDGVDNGQYLGDESGNLTLSDGRVATYTRTGPSPVNVDVTFSYAANGTYNFTYDNCCPTIAGSFLVSVGAPGSDADGDGWWTPGDCDDGNAAIHPGAWDEPNNGIDENCNGYDEYDPCYPAGCADADGDGWNAAYDCNDADASIFPGAYDAPGDGIDQDCDGSDAPVYPDNDGDGWDQSLDCNDFDGSINPGAWDVPNNGVDEDCNGYDAYDPCYPAGCHVDNDGDGWDTSTDCHDGDASIYPGAPDTPGDGIDQNCDGDDEAIPSFLAYLWARRAYEYAHDEAAFGVAYGATDGYDVEWDAVEPPTPPQPDYLRMFFHYPNHTAPAHELSTSYLAPGSGAEYPLRLEWAGQNGSDNVTIEWWAGAFDHIPREWSIYLIDGMTVVDMRANMSDHCCYGWHTFETSGGSGSRDMRIVVTTATRTTLFLNGGWNLLSLPIVPFDDDVSAIFGGRADAAYSWDGAAYVPVTELVPGKGYWVHNPGSWAVIDLYGQPAKGMSLELHPGWNLIGAPYGGTYLPPTPSHVSRTMWMWSGAGYWSTQWLNHGAGHWIYAHEYNASLQLAAVGPDAVTDLLAPSEPAIGEFELPFRLATSGGERDGALLAARTGATEGFDGALDVAEAPRAAAASWAQVFVKGERGLQLDTSVVAPVVREAYTLRMERAGAAGEMILSWSGAQLPEGYVVELVVDAGTRIDMRETSNHAFALSEGRSAIEVQVVLRPADGPVCLVQANGTCAAELPFDPLARLGRVLP